MAKATKGAGGFSQMPKMITDEPSVILKLKKGGSATHKKGGKHEEHGHKTMHKAMGGMMDGATTLPARGGMAPAMAPKMGALAARRAAMKGMPTPLMKKGGKAEGGKEHKAEMHEMQKIEKELKHHEGMKAGKAHHGLKKGGHAKKHFAKGGSAMGKGIDKFETKTTDEKAPKKFLETEMHDGEHHDSVHGTGMVKEGNAGGFKHGGKAHHKHGGKVHHISGHPEGSHEHHKAMAKHHAKMHKEGGSHHHHKMAEHHKAMCKGGKYAIGGTVSDNVAKKFENTMMVDGEHHDSVHGTGEVKESNAGGFKHGGKAHHKHGGKHHYAKGGNVAPDLNLKDTVEGGDWENRPADTTKPGVRMQTTGAVKEGNAGGFKHGGKASKKHFATGVAVNKQGSAVAMPQGKKPASPPVAITRLSGTFKKGGKVKHHADGGAISDYDQRMMEFAPGQNMRDVSPQDVADAKTRAMQTRAYDQARGMGSMSDYEMNRMGQPTTIPGALARRGMGAMTDAERQKMSVGRKHGGRAKK